MSGAYSQFKTDPKLSKEGIWLDYPNEHGEKDFRVKITRAHSTNKEFQRVSENVMKPVSGLIEKKLIQEEALRDKLTEVFANSIIKNWCVWDKKKEEWIEKIQLPNGKLDEVNPQNIKVVLDYAPELFDEIFEQARSFANFKEGELAANTKN